MNQELNLEGVILKALQNYIEGRADEIIKDATETAKIRIYDAVREEVTKTVLTLSEYVSIERFGEEIRLTILDGRKKDNPK